MQQFQSDIVVVGAGTAGCYFAWQAARAGFRVLLLEAKKLDQLGEHIEIFHMDQRSFKEFDIPEPQPPELIHLETTISMYSPDRQVCEQVHYPFFVMNMPAFHRRMHGYVRESGGEIIEEAQVTGIILENGALAGVSGNLKGSPFEARGKLVVDASGLAGAVRTRLPMEYGIENDPVDPARIFYVCLELRNGSGPGFLKGSNAFIFHKAFWNRSYGDDFILGISQPGGFDYAWQKHKQWREEYFGDPGKVVARRQGMVAFRRSLLSCVAERFLVIGDAAFHNKPFSGEGVVSGFTGCKIAAETTIAALQAGAVSREALWPYNVRYYRGQGAKFAAGFAQLPAAAELSRTDVDFLYHQGIIFSGRDFEELNEQYEVRMGPGKLLRTAAVMLWGAITGQFGFNSLKILALVSRQADALKQHFQNYPEHPSGYAAWKQKALALWGEGARHGG